MEKLLKPEEAAVVLGLSTKTLARWRWAGRGPRYRKLGGAVRYSETDLQEFLESAKRRSTSDTCDLSHDGSNRER